MSNTNSSADQPTTEPSECGAPNPGGGAGGPCLRRPGHGGIHFNTVRGWPLAPAPQPAADTEVARWNAEPVVTERDRERRAFGVSVLRVLDGGAA